MWFKPQPWTKVVETYLKLSPLDNNYDKSPKIPLLLPDPKQSCLQEGQKTGVSDHIALGGRGGGRFVFVNGRFMSLEELFFHMER